MASGQRTSTSTTLLTAPSPLDGMAEATLEYGPHWPVPLSPVGTDVACAYGPQAAGSVVAATACTTAAGCSSELPAARVPRAHVRVWVASFTEQLAPSGRLDPAAEKFQSNPAGSGSFSAVPWDAP